LKPGSLNLLKPTGPVKGSVYFTAVFLDIIITLGIVHGLRYMDLEKPEIKGKIFNSHFTALFN
jgi:hypothetical protein